MHHAHALILGSLKHTRRQSVDLLEHVHHVRLFVADNAGVLSRITGVFAKNGISIKEVKQISAEEGKAEIVIITHPSAESSMQKTLDKFRNLEDVYAVKGFIRIEE